MNEILRHIEETVLQPFEDALRNTPQSPTWHAEGDVFTHTMMVVDALHSLDGYNMLDDTKRHVLTIAALLHDIGKIHTTVEINGNWSSPHHAPTGSRMAREILWKDFGLCGDVEKMRIREAICLLIRYHSLPPYAIEMNDGARKLLTVAQNGNLVPLFNIDMLCLLSKADMLGRKCNDMDKICDNVELCRELANDEGCLHGAYPFASDVTARRYAAGNEVWKDEALFDDSWGEVVLMCGLPGTGKDTWISRNLGSMPMISLDEIRRKHAIPPTEPQGGVVQMAKEQAREHLRRHEPFVWNATNISRQMRDSLVPLFESYNARVRIVYLETEWKTMTMRNASRTETVPLDVIEKMLGKMSLPEPTEARKVEWICV